MDYVWLILAMTSTAAVQVFLKAGVLRVGKSPQNLRKLPRFALRIVSNPLVISAIILFIVQLVTMSFALSKFQLSYFYPLYKSVTLVSVVVFSLLLFKEKVSRMGWLGIVTIWVGVVILGIAMAEQGA